MTGRISAAAPSFEELSAWLDNELDEDRMMAIDAYLAENPAVFDDLRRIRAMERALRAAANRALINGADPD